MTKKSKTAEFADNFIDNFALACASEYKINGKIIKLDIGEHGEWEIHLGTNNKAKIWHDSHFIGRCSADNTPDLVNKLSTMLTKEIEERSNKQTEKNVNKELCDYLTVELEKNGFKILNKASTVNHGSYVILGPSGTKYQLKATYKDATVEVGKVLDDRDCMCPVKTFNLSNPNIEKVICSELLEYDGQTELPKAEKKALIDRVSKFFKESLLSEWMGDGFSLANCPDDEDWKVECDGDFITCVSPDEKFNLKFELDIVLKEIK